MLLLVCRIVDPFLLVIYFIKLIRYNDKIGLYTHNILIILIFIKNFADQKEPNASITNFVFTLDVILSELSECHKIKLAVLVIVNVFLPCI